MPVIYSFSRGPIIALKLNSVNFEATILEQCAGALSQRKRKSFSGLLNTQVNKAEDRGFPPGTETVDQINCDTNFAEFHTLN